MNEPSRESGEGTLEQAGERWRLRFVRVLSHPPEKVWRALTEEEHLAAWFPTTIEGKLEKGASLEFRFRGEEFPPVTGEMLECEPPRVLEFSWGFGPDDTRVPEEYRDEHPDRTRFELEPEDGGEGCRLTFTTTYDQVGKSARDAAGWHACLDALVERLGGEDPGDGSPQRWKTLNRRYVELFGPEAGTIGPPESMEEY